MQNFTFGRKGTNWFLFAFVLLIGTLPSFGQTSCVSVADTAPSNLCYLESTIADLEAASGASTTNGDIVFFNEADSTNPLSSSEYLVDGEDYFAASSDSSCSDRVEITVNFEDTTPAPTSNYGNIYSPCLSSESETRPVSDLLRGFVENSADLIAFTTRTGTNTADPSDDLEAGETYFIGQNTSGTCNFSYRTAVRYSPDPAIAPTADLTQEFCEGATIADLEASGTSENTQAIFWYSADNSITRLDSSEELVNGATYYASQIINNEGIPEEPCESSDRAEVTVSLEAPQIVDTVSATVCISAINNPTIEGFRSFYLSLMGNPGEGTFEPALADLVTQYQNDPFAAPFATTYTLDEGCEAIEASVTIIDTEQVNPGEFNNFSLACSTEDFFDLNTLENIDDTATTGGTFSGLGVENNIFDVTQGPGEYTITYTVDENSGECLEGNESTSFNLTVTDDNLQVKPIVVNLCESEVQDNPDVFGVTSYLNNLISLNTNLPSGGSFNPTPSEILQQFQNQNGLGNYPTQYTVNTDCGETTVDIDITVSELTSANAGSFNDIQVSCSATEVIIFEDLSNLDGNANTDGEFTSSDVSVLNDEGNFDPTLATPGETYTITYSVDDSAFCTIEGTSSSTTFEITVTTEANAGDDVEASLCITEVEEIANNFDPQNPEATLTNLFERFDWEGDTSGTFEPSATQLGLTLLAYYQDNNRAPSLTLAGTYTVGDNDSPCGSDQASFNITILDETEANAGSFEDINLTCNAADIIVFDELENLDSNATTGGEFTSNDATVINDEGNFDPSLATPDETYTITYSVDGSSLCTVAGTSSSTSFEITLSEDAEILDPIFVDLCEDEVVDNPTNGEISEFLLAQVAQKPYSMDLNGTFEPGVNEIREQLLNQNGLGDLNTTYTVNCQSVDINITISELTAANAGDFSNIDLACSATDVIVFEDLENLDTNASTGGEFTSNDVTVLNDEGNFDPTLATPGETYIITYSVDDSADCVIEGSSDSVSFEISIQEAGPANAGDIEDQFACTTQGMISLTDYLEDSGAQPGGTFTGEGVENNMFAPSIGENLDGYTITYTVTEEDDDCIIGEDSSSFTIVVSENPNAGADNNTTICVTEVQENPTVGAVRSYFVSLLENGVSRNGTFEPSMEQIRQQYLNNPIGTFSTTYTLGSGSCSDSVELSVEVTDAIDAEVGEIVDQTLCSSDDDLNLYSLITSGNQDGTFEGYENGVFSPSMMGAGSYEVTYTVNEDVPCVEGEASTTFTVEVLQGADAGENLAVSLCTNDETQDLYSLLSAEADMDGEFTLNGEVITNGTMDPSAFDAGTYEVTYTVEAQGDDCGGDDVSTITITLGDAPAAPTTGTALAFCAIDAPTADLLVADGTNLTWYSDAALSMMVSDEDLLVNGDYYVTQSADNGCESEAAVLTVNIVDSPAPTISSDYELCAFDNPTLSDLSAEINETGTITWYESVDSMTALSNNAMLTDGTTYYATLISDNGCESSERLSVTVSLEDCELLFPEAITPNDDGKNDIFVVEKLEREYPNFNITIFNRWGNAVYKGNASTPEWDGTSNQSGNLGDDVLPVGVYFYVVDFNDGSTKPRQGKVYLNR
ncbi:gliding motility-associated C-terminal domain-containing protein [Salegentibacter holothuriorum]|uniref:Gliding motility-associated C-terminal domain-containing protein n=1 Tax=Salegentibacter holothuriorum TaxID=241145 RepID=A0A1T5E293_9FLAO|nr:gliding motility-associated C-terminal domain-containing protein [Salegentibacter holothuriorum]SKB78004.1 gliding motility-associated C-terminal domain-containing protein [Salegentibacter holothuriorum]